MPRRRRAFFVLVAGLVVPAGVSAAACGTGAKAITVGNDCFLATDCDPGLVCVPQKDGRRICTADLTGVTGVPEAGAAPSDAARRDGDAEPDATTDSPSDAVSDAADDFRDGDTGAE